MLPTWHINLPRIHLPGGLYHVILLGNGGQPVFLTDEQQKHGGLNFLNSMKGSGLKQVEKI
jgi:hypothetical protein